MGDQERVDESRTTRYWKEETWLTGEEEIEREGNSSKRRDIYRRRKYDLS